MSGRMYLGLKCVREHERELGKRSVIEINPQIKMHPYTKQITLSIHPNTIATAISLVVCFFLPVRTFLHLIVDCLKK